MPTIRVFDHIENKQILTKGELKSYWESKVRYICGKGILEKFAKDKNYWKVRDYCHYTGKHRGSAHSIWNLIFNVLNEIPVVFHRGSKFFITCTEKEFLKTLK